MRHRSREQGITLVVSLIMLIVLTLIVVSAIRFGNINLRIAGNAQADAEAAAAAQVGLERVVALVQAADKPNNVSAQTYTVSTGGMSYSVAVAKPGCVYSRNVLNQELDATKPADRACYEYDPTDAGFDANGKKIPPSSACKDQQWDVQSTVNDTASTAAKVTVVQGVSTRVSAEVQCP